MLLSNRNKATPRLPTRLRCRLVDHRLPSREARTVCLCLLARLLGRLPKRDKLKDFVISTMLESSISMTKQLVDSLLRKG